MSYNYIVHREASEYKQYMALECLVLRRKLSFLIGIRVDIFG